MVRFAVWVQEGGRWRRMWAGLSFAAAEAEAAELAPGNAELGRSFLVVPHGWHPDGTHRTGRGWE